MDLELAGRGNDVELLQRQYQRELAGTRILVQKTEKSASFRLNVPAIVPPDFDQEKVREALQAAVKLKSWWEAANGLRTG